MNKETITIEYQYPKIEEHQFATFEENLTNNEDIEITNEVNFGFNFDAGIIVCTGTVSYHQGGKPLMKLSVSSYFQLSPESYKKVSVDDGIVMPKVILFQFASLNYGAMRGILYDKTKSTKLNGFVLPPFYFDSIIKDDLHIAKPEKN